jgi:hypothetical protein
MSCFIRKTGNLGKIFPTSMGAVIFGDVVRNNDVQLYFNYIEEDRYSIPISIKIKIFNALSRNMHRPLPASTIRHIIGGAIDND